MLIEIVIGKVLIEEYEGIDYMVQLMRWKMRQQLQ